MGSGRSWLGEAELYAHKAEARGGAEDGGAHREGLAGAAGGPQLHLCHSHAEEEAPPEVGVDKHGDPGLSVTGEDQVVGEAEGGNVDASDGEPAACGGSPSVEGLEEDVEEVWAGGAALGETVGGEPGGAIHTAIPEATAD